MNSRNNHNIGEVFARFQLQGTLVAAAPYGSGHINDTYAVVADQAGTSVRYILQRINHTIFKDPVRLMDNINRVTSHQQAQLVGVRDATRRSLTVLASRDGQPYVMDSQGGYWRCYLFIEHARTYDAVENVQQAYEAARAFGRFQATLDNLPGGRLYETIPQFHDTPRRFAALLDAIGRDAEGRAGGVQAEIDFFLRREHETAHLINLNRSGRIPERITHNDTKLNNVMLDDKTGEGICVIDLDTVMPGLALYDFGDLVRTATSPAREDEKNLERVYMQMPMFVALARGYLSSTSHFLTPDEVENLPFAGKLITLEVGMRFLTDYLNGDVYFKVARPDHNLDRCRTQIRLVESIEEQSEDMQREVQTLMEDAPALRLIKG